MRKKTKENRQAEMKQMIDEEVELMKYAMIKAKELEASSYPEMSATIELAKRTKEHGWWHGLDIGVVASAAELLAEALLLGGDGKVSG